MGIQFGVITRLLGITVVTLAMAVPFSAEAQSRDYLFGAAKGSLLIRAGVMAPRAGSDLFDFTRSQLTVEEGDFLGGFFSGELNFAATPRVNMVLAVGYSQGETASEFRDWVGADDLPIEQVTRFSTMPVTLGFKAYLKDQGRSISQFAWIPTKINPYIGGGGGLIRYSFEQFGEFLDEETLDIFEDSLESTGNSAVFYGVAGLDASLTSRVYLNGEARYNWANGTLGRDFVGFDKLDLAGFQFGIGVAFRF